MSARVTKRQKNQLCVSPSHKKRQQNRPCVIFYNIEADALWAFTDILSALYVCITVFIIIAKHKEIFRLFGDFWQRYLPEKEAGKNPPYVTFDCREEE